MAYICMNDIAGKSLACNTSSCPVLCREIGRRRFRLISKEYYMDGSHALAVYRPVGICMLV